MDPINVLSCFDGMSCGQLALQDAGIPVANYYASEIDKYAIKVTQANFPNTVQLGSILDWREWKDQVSDVKLFLAGFPCQSYSVAGGQLGIEDKRGQLIYPMLEVIEYFKPEDILLENVKGFMSSRHGKVFEFLLTELNKYGYAVDWKIINSALVSAQNRERIYIFGKRLDVCQGLVYDYELGDKHDKPKKNNRRNDGAI